MAPTRPNPVVAPPHVLQLLDSLHQKSLEQEAAITKGGNVFSANVLKDLEDTASKQAAKKQFDELMLDKFIALDQDKCQFVYQLILSMGALNVVEAGTSFGVSTIYLSLAVGENMKTLGREGRVIATEKEAEKAKVARGYWRDCGEPIEKNIDLREGNLLETLKKDVPQVDLLLLDIWTALALPTLKLIKPHLRPGSVVLADNTEMGSVGYEELLSYLRDPKNGFRNMTLPFNKGLEMNRIHSGRASHRGAVGDCFFLVLRFEVEPLIRFVSPFLNQIKHFENINQHLLVCASESIEVFVKTTPEMCLDMANPNPDHLGGAGTQGGEQRAHFHPLNHSFGLCEPPNHPRDWLHVPCQGHGYMLDGGQLQVPPKNDLVMPVHILEPKPQDCPKVSIKLRPEAEELGWLQVVM